MNCRALVPLLLALAAGPALAQDADAKKAHDKEVQDVLDEFKKAFKGSEDDRAGAVKILAKVQDKKIADTLARLLADPSLSLRIEAAKVLGDYVKDAAVAQAIAKELAGLKKEPQVQIAYLESLGRIRDWSVAPTVIRLYSDPDLKVCQTAMVTSGRIRSPAFVKELIDFLRDAGAGTASAKAATLMDFRIRRAELRITAQMALREITGETFPEAKAWEEWWKANSERVTAKLQKEEKEERERLAKERKEKEAGADSGRDAKPAKPAAPEEKKR